jgi:hypothetical protein
MFTRFARKRNLMKDGPRILRYTSKNKYMGVEELANLQAGSGSSTLLVEQ